MKLDTTFRHFHTDVTAARAPAAPHGLAGDDRLDALARLGIYRHAYMARLVGALRELFPQVAEVLGDGFDDTAEAWLREHPPAERSLFHIGAGFPDALEGVARDLARVDHARRVVFDAPDDPPVTVEQLSAIPGDRWPSLRPRRVMASAVLGLEHDISQQTEAAARSPSTVLVWRVGSTVDVRHRALDPLEAAMIEALDGGGTLGVMVEHLAVAAGPGAVGELTRIFAIAAREGWLALDESAG